MSALLGVLLQISISVTAPDTIVARQPAVVFVRAVAPGTTLPVIHAPSFAPLSVVRTTEVTEVDRNGAVPSARVERRYVVVAPRAGSVWLASFEARVGGESARSPRVAIAVRSTPDPRIPAVVERTRIDTSAGPVDFHAIVLPDTVYVGQQATYEVGVFVNEEVSSRLRRNPEFVPPELQSMLAFDLALPGPPVARREVAGRRYEVHVFRRALFPLTAGVHAIPSARLNYSVPLSASFFSREESHTARSESLTVVAIDPPVAGRPPDYRGAVGVIDLDTRVESRQGRVGDPLLVTVSVSGTGNVNFFPRPELRVDWGRVVRADERVQLDTSGALLSGTKEFDYLITPQRSGAFEVPPIRYPFFDPSTERYAVAVANRDSVEILAGTLAAVDSAHADSMPALLAIRRELGAPTGAPLSSRPGFWLVMLLAPTPAAVLALVRRPRAPVARRPQDQLRAIVRGGRAADPTMLRHAFAAAIATRIGASSEALSNRDELRRVLRRAGVSAVAAAEVSELLAALDRAVFSRDSSLPSDVGMHSLRVYMQVHEEAKPLEPASPKPRVVPTVLLLATIAGMLGLAGDVRAAQRPAESVRIERSRGADDADARAMQHAQATRELFDAARRSYTRREFPRAERLFGDVALAAPRYAAAWANFGTAAWAMGDTAAAVVGWQRALRLDPFAGDVRDHLTLTPGFDSGPFGTVPLVSEHVLAVVGGGAWLVACALALIGVQRRQRALLRAAWWPAGVAVLMFGAGVRVRDIGSGRRAAVIAAGAPLRATPALGADPGAQVQTGELARTVGRQGAWTRIRLADGRGGWLESERLEPLELPRVPLVR